MNIQKKFIHEAIRIMRVGDLYSAKNYPYSHTLDEDPSKTYVLVNPNKQVNPKKQFGSLVLYKILVSFVNLNLL